MLDIHQSPAKKGNAQLIKAQRSRGQDNLEWLRDHIDATDGTTVLLLLGGKDVLSHRLRTAQSHARHDLSPSHWSDVFILADPAQVGTQVSAQAAPKAASTSSQNLPQLFGISLTPQNGFGFPPLTNALQEMTMEPFLEPKRFPNIAVLRIPVACGPVFEALEQFKKQSNVVNATELLARWLAYGWGVAPNPLLEGLGLPGAVCMDAVFSAVNYDLTPGLANHSCCPEAIWQAVKWWQELRQGEDGTGKIISGAYVVSDSLP